MCNCEEEFARRYFPHQITNAVELNTQERIPVTLGFQANICNTCKSVPEEAAPKSSIPGRTSKITRYYWREIEFLMIPEFVAWAEQVGYTNWLTAMIKEKQKHNEFRKEAISKIKEIHKISPKYTYSEKSQSDVIQEFDVTVEGFHVEYGKPDGEKLLILDSENWYSPEEYVAHVYEGRGFKSIFLESRPFHALFAVLLWPIIQDRGDVLSREVHFGDRFAFETGEVAPLVRALLPSDFGSPGYYERRQQQLDAFLDELPEARRELLVLFDENIDPSESLRQYLWVHQSRDVDTARLILEIMKPEEVHRILGYMVKDYYRRHCGWPDLLVFRKGEFILVEVKSSQDKLSEQQKVWIEGNHKHIGLPFRIVKLHKRR